MWSLIKLMTISLYLHNPAPASIVIDVLNKHDNTAIFVLHSSHTKRKCILVRSSHVLSHYHKACQISVTSWQLSCLLHPGDWFWCRLISRGQRLASGQPRRAPNNSLGLWVTAAITAGLACTASAASQVKRGQTQRGRRMIKLFKFGKLCFKGKLEARNINKHIVNIYLLFSHF